MSGLVLEVPVFGVGTNGAPSRKGCVVNGQLTMSSEKLSSSHRNMSALFLTRYNAERRPALFGGPHRLRKLRAGAMFKLLG